MYILWGGHLNMNAQGCLKNIFFLAFLDFASFHVFSSIVGGSHLFETSLDYRQVKMFPFLYPDIMQAQDLAGLS